MKNGLKLIKLFPRMFEVLLNYGLAKLEEFLVNRIDFFDFILVSRVHNMVAFNQAIKSIPDLTSRVKLIYDARKQSPHPGKLSAES